MMSRSASFVVIKVLNSALYRTTIPVSNAERSQTATGAAMVEWFSATAVVD